MEQWSAMLRAVIEDHPEKGGTVSDRDLLEIRVRLTRLASELALARSERDIDRISAEVSRVRASLDNLLLMLPAA